MSKEVKSEEVFDMSNELSGSGEVVFHQKLDECVKTTNEIIGSIKKYNKKLFDQVKQSYHDLYDEKDPKSWKRYKILIDLDESTINKIVKIIKNDTIMKFYDQLPGSWGTLSVLTTMETSDLLEVIETGLIDCRSTKKEVLDIRNQYKGKQSKSGDTSTDKESVEVNQLWIDLDELDVSVEERVRIKELFNELESYGFTILNDKESQSDDS